jgi:hypothetical protein
MSITINLAGQHAVLADGQWRSANERLRELLNAHLEASQLEVGGHLTPFDRELALARLACDDLGGKITDARNSDTAPARQPDGTLTVF